MLRSCCIPLAMLAAIGAGPRADPVGPLPDAKTVLADFIDAVGGESAIHAVTALDARGRIRLPGGRDPGQFRWVVADGGRAFFETEFPGLGRSAFGADGTVGWHELDLPSGRTVERATLASIDRRRRQANWFELAFTLPARAQEMRTIGPAEFDGVHAWDIELTRADGRRERVFIDRETSLMLGFTTALTAQPDAPVITVRFGDWRPVGDLQLFHTIGISGGRTRVRLEVTQLTLNTPEPAHFTPPADLPDVE